MPATTETENGYLLCDTHAKTWRDGGWDGEMHAYSGDIDCADCTEAAIATLHVGSVVTVECFDGTVELVTGTIDSYTPDSEDPSAAEFTIAGRVGEFFYAGSVIGVRA